MNILERIGSILARRQISQLEAQLAEAKVMVALLEQLNQQLQPLVSPPVMRKQVDGNYIYGIMNAVVPSATHIYLSDNLYWLCSTADIERFLAQDNTNKMGYIQEERDCDDFSYRLMGQLSTPEWSGIAFGIVWTNVHALNCFIDDTGKFWFIEPQTAKLQDKLELWQGSEILFILM